MLELFAPEIDKIAKFDTLAYSNINQSAPNFVGLWA